MNANRGYTLLETMIVVAIVALMMAAAIPTMMSAVANSRARAVVNKFVQDFAWVRGQSATGTNTASLTLNSDCSWTASVVVDSSLANAAGITAQVSAHSFSAAQISSAVSSFSCSLASGSLPATFSFSPQGYLNTSATVTFTGPVAGNPWRVRILTSGATVTGTAS